MPTLEGLDPDLRSELEAIYQQIMWLARCKNVTPSQARAWYTHVMAEKVKRRVRQFTGKVSKTASESVSAPLRLEHYQRMQTKLTDLVEKNIKNPDTCDFIQTLLKLERVHIVTLEENYLAMRAGGDYKKAGIVLVPWNTLEPERQTQLWKKMLRGKVSNANNYKL